jgi:hypothetical protein
LSRQFVFISFRPLCPFLFGALGGGAGPLPAAAASGGGSPIRPWFGRTKRSGGLHGTQWRKPGDIRAQTGGSGQGVSPLSDAVPEYDGQKTDRNERLRCCWGRARGNLLRNGPGYRNLVICSGVQCIMRVLQAGLLTLALCSSSPAMMIPQPNLAKRIESAQIIVVAKMISGTSLASGSQVSSDIVLHIDRGLKGDLTPGSEITAHLEGQGFWVVPNARQSTVTEPVYGIWFLNADAHSYTVLSRDGKLGELFLAPAVLPEDAPAANAGESPAASVLNELVSALRFVAVKQGTVLSPKAEHEGSSDQRKAAGLAIGRFRALTEDLRSMDRSLTHPVYRDFAVDQSAPLRALGIQGLIEANDPEGIKSAAANWDELAASADVNPIIGSLMGFSNGSDGGAVRALGSLATRENAEPGLQQSASYALRSIHTREAVAALVALLGAKGEKDENAERVRINALSGLCLFVRNAPTVTPQAVVSMSWMQSQQPAPLLNAETQSYCFMGGVPGHTGDLEPYVSYWNSWWVQHRIEIEGK